MALHVGFIDDIHSARVAQVVPVVVLRIVRVADRVAVRFLHEPEILLVALLRDEMAEHRVRFVAVGAFELDFLAVEEVAAVLYFGDAEAEHGRHPFLAVVDDELVAVRLFCAPEFRGDDGEFAGGGAADEFVVPGVKRGLRAAIHLDVKFPRAAVFALDHRTRRREEVPHALLRAREQPGAAEDAGEAEHVLVLEICAVGIAVDLECDEVVFAGAHEAGHVELRRRAAVLGEADIFAVHPKVEEGVDAVELEEDVGAVPFGGHLEMSAVAADRVARVVGGEVFRGLQHDGGAARNVLGEGIALVCVDGRPPAAFAVSGAGRLPRARHAYRRPQRVVEVFPVELLLPLVRVARPGKAPRAVGVERKLPRRVFRQNAQRRLFVRKRRERRPHGLSPKFQALVVLPFTAVDFPLFRHRRKACGQCHHRCNRLHAPYYTIKLRRLL